MIDYEKLIAERQAAKKYKLPLLDGVVYADFIEPSVEAQLNWVDHYTLIKEFRLYCVPRTCPDMKLHVQDEITKVTYPVHGRDAGLLFRRCIVEKGRVTATWEFIKRNNQYFVKPIIRLPIMASIVWQTVPNRLRAYIELLSNGASGGQPQNDIPSFDVVEHAKAAIERELRGLLPFDRAVERVAPGALRAWKLRFADGEFPPLAEPVDEKYLCLLIR